VVKLGIAPSEFWEMTLPELVAMLNMHVKAQQASGPKPKLSEDWVQSELNWLRGGDDPGN
jgi:hypothetical protein